MKDNKNFRIAVRGLIEWQGNYLLLQRAKPARGEMGYWELPGGGLDFGESPQVALAREIDEETGLTVVIAEPLSVWHYMRGDDTEIIGMTFKCHADSAAVQLSDEHINYKWLSIAQIKTMKIFDELQGELDDMLTQL